MKKILSAIISISILAASMAVPVSSDYTAPEVSYDITEVNNTYDEGTATNAIDGSPAMQIGDSFERIFSTNIDTTKEFYLGFDFCFDTDAGEIQIPKFKNSGSIDKVGPIITFDGTNLRTQTGGSSYQNLGAFTTGEWYHGEIEGRTGIGQQYTTFRLYKDGELVQETASFNMRNLSSEGRSFNGMQAKNISIDNVLLVQEKPDTITLSSDSDEMNAGGELALDYVMKRLDKEFNKYAVTWSVYDESNTNPLADENISISSGGILSALIKSEEQTVTVRATTVFGGKELYGSKQIKINAVSTSDEKFDTITVSGPSSVKAGTSTEFTFTASKDGTDVTNTLSGDDIAWSVYDSTGIIKNNNIGFNVENGVLTIDDDVIAQNITLRASSASGAIYGYTPVEITWADSQKETVLSYSACETELTNTALVDSWDGSKAYQTSDSITFGFGDQTAYAITEVDVKFDNTDGHGFTLYNNNGSENSNIRVNNGNIAQQTGGSKWTTIAALDTDAWYHIEFIYLNGSTSGYNVYKYTDTSNGTMELVKKIEDCNRRNDKPYGKISFTQGLVIDNFKVSLVIPDDVTLTSPGQYMFAGETAQFTATAKRAGHSLANTSGVAWSVLDSDNLPIIDGTVTIDDTGLLTVDSMAAAQTVTIEAKTASGATDSAVMNIQVAEIFTVTNIGINEAGDKIVKLYVDKNFYYVDDVTFIVSIKDADDLLKSVKVVSSFGDRLALGENEITTDISLPADFDPETYKVEVLAWTNTEKSGGGKITTDAFTPVYDAQTGNVTISTASSGDQQTLLVLTEDSSVKDENIAQVDQQNGTIDRFVLPKGIENGTYYIRIGGSDGSIQLATLKIGDGSPLTPTTAPSSPTDAPAPPTDTPAPPTDAPETPTDAPPETGIVVDSFESGDSDGEYIAKVTNNENEAVEIALIVTVYDEDGVLKSIQLENKTVETGNTETVSVTNSDT